MSCVWMCLLLGLAAIFTSHVSCQMKGPGSCPCPRILTTVLRQSQLKSYERYKAGFCHFDAIMFTNKRGWRGCFDPQKQWVKKAVKYLDHQREAAAVKKHQRTFWKIQTEAPLNTTSHFNHTT